MRTLARRVMVLTMTGLMTIGIAAPAAAVNPSRDASGGPSARSDNRPGPLTARQEQRRKAAQELILSGQRTPNQDGVVQLAGDKYYEAAVTGTGRLFTILSEFGDAGSGRFGTVPGPLHNEIAKPNRETVDGQPNADFNPALPYDNNRHWKADFNTASYLDLFFGDGESFADFYTKQSSGNYTVAGDVSDWVTVPGNASAYGDNAIEDFGGAWQFIEDSGNAWYAAQVAAGQTDAQINAYLATFDVWDRYDQDEDGNFDEPDGYLDHFQAVHAGEGEDAGGGAQGEDAIWSHRWYVNATDFGLTGPTVDGQRSSSAARRSVTPATGSATTRWSRRTVASVSSRTSSPMTWACPTSTTPTPARTAPPSGRSCRPARGCRRRRPRTSVPDRTTWVRGRSSSSAGSTTRWCPADRAVTSPSARRPAR